MAEFGKLTGERQMVSVYVCIIEVLSTPSCRMQVISNLMAVLYQLNLFYKLIQFKFLISKDFSKDNTNRIYDPLYNCFMVKNVQTVLVLQDMKKELDAAKTACLRGFLEKSTVIYLTSCKAGYYAEQNSVSPVFYVMFCPPLY